MEPYRSTLATTAAAVLGLVVAAHVLHPGNFEDMPRSARAAVVSAEAPAAAAAWVDPPAESRSSPKPSPASDVTALLEPRISVALPPEATMASALPGEMTSAPTRTAQAARAEARPRRRAAHRGDRTRHLAAARASAGAVSAPVRVNDHPAERQVRADPIGDLLRGLGLGRDG